MPVNIHGKEYHTVAERVHAFRETAPDLTIETEIVRWEGDDVVVKASISDNGKLIATGLAHEVRGSTNINKTSHVENCETSAIGRALAAFGLAGTEYATADEVANAIAQQQEKEIQSRINELLIENTQTILKYAESVLAIKAGIALKDYSTASEEWFSLTDEDKTILWKAPSKGGVFTTEEREIMKSKEFREANGSE
jgi:deoxycytidylate deaminase